MFKILKNVIEYLSMIPVKIHIAIWLFLLEIICLINK